MRQEVRRETWTRVGHLNDEIVPAGAGGHHYLRAYGSKPRSVMKQIVDCLTHPVGIEEGHELVTRLDS